MDEETKEVLGVTREDFWYYPGFALLLSAMFVDSVGLVSALGVGSLVFLAIYLFKSFPKYRHSEKLSPTARSWARIGNFALAALHVTALAVRLVYVALK